MVALPPTTPQAPRLPQNDKEVLDWARYFSEFVLKTFRGYVQKNTAQDSVLLASPNGSVYTVKVTDLGALQVDLVRTA